MRLEKRSGIMIKENFALPKTAQSLGGEPGAVEIEFIEPVEPIAQLAQTGIIPFELGIATMQRRSAVGDRGLERVASGGELAIGLIAIRRKTAYNSFFPSAIECGGSKNNRTTPHGINLMLEDL